MAFVADMSARPEAEYSCKALNAPWSTIQDGVQQMIRQVEKICGEVGAGCVMRVIVRCERSISGLMVCRCVLPPWLISSWTSVTS